MPESVFTLETLRSLPLSDPAKFAVLGDPVAQSLSPFLHNAGFGARGLEFRYIRLHVPSARLAEAFALLREREFLGWNLTIPHKAAGMSLVDDLDPAAARLGGINTIASRDGRLIGFNTDAFGMAAALEDLFGWRPAGGRMAILGAGGGTGHALSVYFAGLAPRKLILANRNPERLRGWPEDLGASVETVPWSRIDRVFGEADIVINATSVGLDGRKVDWDPAWLQPRHRIVDAVYSSGTTPVVDWARRAGQLAADGLAMLYHQGAAAFPIWVGQPVPATAMKDGLLRAANRESWYG